MEKTWTPLLEPRADIKDGAGSGIFGLYLWIFLLIFASEY